MKLNKLHYLYDTQQDNQRSKTMATKQIHISLQEELKEEFETHCNDKCFDKSKIVSLLIVDFLAKEKDKGEQP